MSLTAGGGGVPSRYKNFCDLDGVKKKELERRKKLRLEQVRTQSKELSSKIRDRVKREKHLQLRKIEEIKEKELLSWKEQHVNATMADYYYCLSNVGDAHAAAERENEETQNFEAQQRENRKIAVIRGRKALQTEKLKNLKKSDRPVKRKSAKKDANVNKNVSPQVLHEQSDKVLSEDDNNELNESDDDDDYIVESSEFLQKSLSKSPEIANKPCAQVDKPKNVVRFSQVSDLIEERRKARNICDQILENSFDASKSETIPKSPIPVSYLRTKSPGDKSSHAPKSAKPIKSPVRTFQKSPVIPKRFAPQQNQPFRTGTSSATNPKMNLQRDIVAKKVNTPNKVNVPKGVANRVMKQKKLVASSKFTSPQRREFVPRFTKNPIAKPGILKNGTEDVITETATVESPEKVQFYDHFSRYGKEYDAQPGLVQRELNPPSMSANEAARVQNEMDKLRFQQLKDLRQKTDQRSKESLEKNQSRKDYEALTRQLEEFCKEENRLRTFAMPNEHFSEERLAQLAQNRQQNMNRAFEDIYHKPVVITCAPIGSNENSSSSDVNVATSPSPDKQKQRVDPFDSSDSCTSILLGYVDNRSRRLVKDIKQCKDDSDGNKRKKLVTLLTRLDQLRKLLLDEIVRNSSLNLEPFYRSVIEVETKKKEILADPDANKENMKKQAEQLKKREHIVKSQEMKLDKKIKELFLKEQGKAAKTDDDTFESLTSETITSSVDQPEPVKILIEVKNAAKIRKSRHPTKTQSTNHDVGSEYQHKSSVGGSSASTAYRSPPTTFQTDFTRVLANQPVVKSTKNAVKPTKPAAPVQKLPLGHYITRLLGMSQQSIDQLGVSTSSSISTPTDSVINVPENLSPAIIDGNHLNRIQMKIDENLRFSKEVDDSFKQVEVHKKGREKDQDAKSLKERQPKQPEKNRNTEQKKQSSDAILKSPERSKKLTNKNKRPEVVTDSAIIPPEIPENSKRIIADLAKQIEQVRQDKQKLLEKTLSSGHSSNSSSGKGFDSTEYRDFAVPSTKFNQRGEENICSSQASDVISLPGNFIDEESKNLMNTKQIGISFSRDSGIGSSRPVTSTDFRVSPDIKLTEKHSMPIQVSKVVLPENSDQPAVRKSAKPPISLKRYSPQLDTEQLQPHDLSTINEVETSAASRFNQSTRNETSDSSVPAPYAMFPTFVEYAKMQQELASVDESTDGEKSYSETVLKKMLEITCLSETDLNYRKLDEPQTNQNTSEKSINNELENEYIDVAKEIKQRRLMEVADPSSSSTSDSKLLTLSTSSDLLAKDFNRIGLNWASAMLKKTSTAQNLESSSSSTKSTSHIPTKIHQTSDGNSSDDRINGNPLNIRDFLARELLKRTQLSSSSSMSDNSTLTDQFLRSLLSSSTNSSVQQQATLRTSTPNRNLSSESEKFVALNDNGHTVKDEHLFSGESILSSVRGGTSQTETSKETSE